MTLYDGKSAVNKDEINRLKKERKLKQLKVFFFRTRGLTRLMMFMILLGLFMHLLSHPFWIFSKERILTNSNKALEIHGNKLVSNDEIIHRIQEIDFSPQPIYQINTKIFEDKLKEINVIHNVFVRRFIFPNRLSVFILEKMPLLVLQSYTDRQIIGAVAHDYSVIESRYLSESLRKKLPHVILGDSLIKYKPEDFAEYYKLTHMVEQSLGEAMVELDLTNDHAIFAKTVHTPILIGKMNHTTEQRIQRLFLIKEEIKKYENKLQYVDLRWDDSIPLKLKGKNKSDTI